MTEQFSFPPATSADETIQLRAAYENCEGKGTLYVYDLLLFPMIKAKIPDLSCGTPFQQKVWRQLTKIPCGEVRSYAWVAKKIGCPKGARAVGQAVKKNPFPIVIPCHRVIASDGSIGGFSLGVKKKRALLAREGVVLHDRHRLHDTCSR